MQVIDQLILVIPFQEHCRAQRFRDRGEKGHVLHVPVPVQHVEERLEGMGREIRLQARVEDAVAQVRVDLDEVVPTGEAQGLLPGRRQESAEAGHAGW